MRKDNSSLFRALFVIIIALFVYFPTACDQQTTTKFGGQSTPKDMQTQNSVEGTEPNDKDIETGNDVEDTNVNGLKNVLDKIAELDIYALDSTKQLVKADFDIKHWIKSNRDFIAHEEDTDSPINSQLTSYYNAFSEEDKLKFASNFDMISRADAAINEIFRTEGLDFYKDKFHIDTEGYTESDILFCERLLNDINEAIGDKHNTFESSFVVNDSTPFNKEAFYDMMIDTSGVYWGSAGCSIRAAEAAGEMMNFTVDVSKCSKKEMVAGVKECYAKLNPSERFYFDTTVTSIISAVDQLEKDPNSLGDLESAQITIDFDNYSRENRDKFMAALTDLSGINY